MLDRILLLGRLMIASPSRAAAASRERKNLAPALWLYAAFITANMFFYYLKPLDFPDASLAAPAAASGLLFWVKAALWQPPFEAVAIALMMGFIVWLREGALPLRLVMSALWTAFALAVNIVAYTQHGGGSRKPFFVLGALLAFAPFYFLLRRAQGWKPLIAFMAGVNSIGLAVLIPLEAAVLMNIPEAFKALQIIGALWLLGAMTLGLRELSGLRLPRAFMAVLFAMFFQIAFAFTLHLLGLPVESLKAALIYG